MFKRDVVRVARRGDLGQAQVAADLDISVESVFRWVRQADIDDGVVDGQTRAEQTERVQPRREKRRLEVENEILRRAAAYFAVKCELAFTPSRGYRGMITPTAVNRSCSSPRLREVWQLADGRARPPCPGALMGARRHGAGTRGRSE